MRMVNAIYNEAVKDYKLSKKNQKLLSQLIEESHDYWTVPNELKECLNNEKLHMAFTYYTNETDQRDLTSKKLTQLEIEEMERWASAEYEKCKHRVTSIGDVIIENIEMEEAWR